MSSADDIEPRKGDKEKNKEQNEPKNGLEKSKGIIFVQHPKDDQKTENRDNQCKKDIECDLPSSSGSSSPSQSHHEEFLSAFVKKSSKKTKITQIASTRPSNFYTETNQNDSKALSHVYNAPESSQAIKKTFTNFVKTRTKHRETNLFEGISCKFMSSLRSQNTSKALRRPPTVESINSRNWCIGPKLQKTSSFSPSIQTSKGPFTSKGSFRSGFQPVNRPSRFQSEINKGQNSVTLERRFTQFTTKNAIWRS